MNYLLDTHTFLWFLEGNNNLSEKARISIENTKNIKFISIASIWEVAIKLNLGKLKLDIKLEELKEEILKNNFEILPLDFEHIIDQLELLYKCIDSITGNLRYVDIKLIENDNKYR